MIERTNLKRERKLREEEENRKKDTEAWKRRNIK
jgi:hypothetical protein